MSENNGHSSLTTPIVFDSLEPLFVEVTLGGEQFILREATEDAAVKYRDANVRGLKMNDGKLVGLSGVGDVQSILVASCLFRVKKIIMPDGSEERREAPVLPIEVRKWKCNVVKALFDRIKEMSPGLDEKESRETLDKRLVDTADKLRKLPGGPSTLKESLEKFHKAIEGWDESELVGIADPTSDSP